MKIENNHKFLFVLCGESGCGKTTIAELLEKHYDLTSIQSYTDRPPRFTGETGHIFVSKEEFDKLTNLVAYTYFNGHRYCGTAEQVDNNDIYIVDRDGIAYLKSHYQGNKIIKVIYLKVDEKDRLIRMIHRKDGHDKAIERVKHDKTAFEGIEQMADLVVENKYPYTCMGDIYNYIEKCWKEKGSA